MRLHNLMSRAGSAGKILSVLCRRVILGAAGGGAAGAVCGFLFGALLWLAHADPGAAFRCGTIFALAGATAGALLGAFSGLTDRDLADDGWEQTSLVTKGTSQVTALRGSTAGPPDPDRRGPRDQRTAKTGPRRSDPSLN
jgi:hypothetical protein